MDELLNIAAQALWLAFQLALIPLVAGLVVALVFGVLQSMTQVKDESISSIPRNITVFLVVLITLPWMISSISSFASNLLEMIQRINN